MTEMEILCGIIARDLAADVHRARTFPGGYVPTARVLVQRQRHANRDCAGFVASYDEPDAYVEPDDEAGFVVGLRDNRDPERHLTRLQRVAASLRDVGYRAKVGGAFVRVAYDAKSEAAIEKVASTYLAILSRESE